MFEGGTQPIVGEDTGLAMNVQVSPCAILLLRWLHESFGPVALIHSRQGRLQGAVHWVPMQRFAAPLDLLELARLPWGNLYVRAGDRPLFGEYRMVLEVAFGEDAETSVFNEMRLVSLLRPRSESDFELASAANRRRARSEAKSLLKRLGRSGGH
jgi:hypothetical protein